jgi:hypothetical protein
MYPLGSEPPWSWTIGMTQVLIHPARNEDWRAATVGIIRGTINPSLQVGILLAEDATRLALNDEGTRRIGEPATR